MIVASINFRFLAQLFEFSRPVTSSIPQRWRSVGFISQASADSTGLTQFAHSVLLPDSCSEPGGIQTSLSCLKIVNFECWPLSEKKAMGIDSLGSPFGSFYSSLRCRWSAVPVPVHLDLDQHPVTAVYSACIIRRPTCLPMVSMQLCSTPTATK